MKFKYIWILIVFLSLAACNDHDYTIPDTSVDLEPGNADFSTYVSIGNSLTSGYTDAALFVAAQQNSFPNILSQKFSLVGGGDFSQPLTSDNIGGLLLGGNVIANPRLYFDGSGPAVLPGTPTTEVSNIKPGPYNNMGVPGARVTHLLANGYGNIAGLAQGLANPYFVRMASTANASVLEDAMAMNPTFFTLWIGNNDVLGYAASGGDGSSDITDAGIFQFAYNKLVTTLTSGGAKGVILNLPDVTLIPYFTTVPFNPLDPSNPDFGPMIPLLNATFAPLNQAFAFLGVKERSIVFSETEASPIIIHDESIADISAQLFMVLKGAGLDPLTARLLAFQYGQCRPANKEDLITLRSATAIATLNMDNFKKLVSMGVPQDKAGQLSINGITYPMEDKWVVLPSEQDEVKQATATFNSIIKSEAQKAGLAFVDANAFMEQLSTQGLLSDGFELNSSLVKGGVFSLDGVHLTARGYALVSKYILEAIDVTYESNFKAAGEMPDIGDYPAFYPETLK
jgi:lysophospholipase L1-like esterase